MSGKVDLKELNTQKVIECNNCGKDIKTITAKNERLTDNRVGYFFCCDNCGFKYPFAAITERGQFLLKKIQKKKRDMRNFPGLAKSLNFALKQDLVAYQKEFHDSYTEEEVVNE